MLSEKQIESYLVKQTKALGGRAYKFVSPGNDGVPDRMVCFPSRRIAFVELKAPGKKSRPLQTLQQKRLLDFGFQVFADIDSYEKVDMLLKQILEEGDAK